ncbi:hypothetical protein TRFO_31760 [Tritrichomonas foetus]|uniref:Ubiquitin-like domain-containing protein n=1 Tax=Tritrichomonas foetus TaxID=1144522 RepID=A0A1J4JV80_9EUKA|nr:hypothetical protein TRFO_31760 [Tritrichomonas foetus]|eukprot:OHT01436.1 hypothetical protein TRFO_31760 [Tritrichomonas foetus]
MSNDQSSSSVAMSLTVQKMLNWNTKADKPYKINVDYSINFVILGQLVINEERLQNNDILTFYFRGKPVNNLTTINELDPQNNEIFYYYVFNKTQNSNSTQKVNDVKVLNINAQSDVPNCNPLSHGDLIIQPLSDIVKGSFDFNQQYVTPDDILIDPCNNFAEYCDMEMIFQPNITTPF